MRKRDDVQIDKKTVGASSSSTLQKLKVQQERLKTRIQKMEARGKVQERKRDVRRKILVGAYMLNEAQKNNTLEELREAMLVFLKRDSDKELFRETKSMVSVDREG